MSCNYFRIVYHGASADTPFGLGKGGNAENGGLFCELRPEKLSGEQKRLVEEIESLPQWRKQLSNRHRHPCPTGFEHCGRRYATVEAAYQARKLAGTGRSDLLRRLESPTLTGEDAWICGRSHPLTDEELDRWRDRAMQVEWSCRLSSLEGDTVKQGLLLRLACLRAEIWHSERQQITFRDFMLEDIGTHLLLRCGAPEGPWSHNVEPASKRRRVVNKTTAGGTDTQGRNVLFFSGSGGPLHFLSNLFLHDRPFEYTPPASLPFAHVFRVPTKCNCGEQALLLAKSALFGDERRWERLRALRSPKGYRRIGEECSGFCTQTWRKHQRDILTDIAVQRFADPDLQLKLLHTGDAVLAEAETTGDKKLRLHDALLDLPEADTNGCNLAGVALMAARKKLLVHEID